MRQGSEAKPSSDVKFAKAWHWFSASSVYKLLQEHRCLVGASQFEFIAVVLIMGIVLSVLLPKFRDNVDEAHRLSVQFTGRALNSAVHSAHLQWIAMGQPQQVDRILGFGNENIATSTKGWPTDADRGLESSHSVKVSDDLPRCRRLWNALMKTTFDHLPDERTLSRLAAYEISAPSDNVCRYSYTVGSYLGYIDYNLDVGEVTIQAEAQ